MNPIDDTKSPPPLRPVSEGSDFLKFLEEMKGLLTELSEAVADSKNALQSFSALGAPIQAKHQVKILIDFEKTRLEVQSLLQKIESGGESFQVVGKDGKPSLLKGSEHSALKEARCIASAGTSEKKAGEILFSLRAPPAPSPQNPILSSKGEASSFQTSSPNSPPLLKEPEINRPASQSVRSFPFKAEAALPINFSVQARAAEILQKIRPLLDHLLVVVETQENMSKPSQKWTGLVRSLIRSQASLAALDASFLLKPAPSAKTLEPAQISQAPKPASDKSPLIKNLAPLSQTPLSPSPLEALSSPSLPFQDPSSKTFQEAKYQQPFAAPFTAEKKIERRKKSWKKKLKGFWTKRDPEEEEKN